jgi:predicted nucleic acid-binding protein
MDTFVDTGAWYASVVPGDPRHRDLLLWLSRNPARLITTDYVIDETLTLLRARGERTRAVELGRQFFDLAAISVHSLETSDLRGAWSLFRDEPYRDWSFTDCTSKVVIERLHLKRVLTLDQHFKEFGALEVLP